MLERVQTHHIRCHALTIKRVQTHQVLLCVQPVRRLLAFERFQQHSIWKCDAYVHHCLMFECTQNMNSIVPVISSSCSSAGTRSTTLTLVT
jgi:hypothetical protein